MGNRTSSRLQFVYGQRLQLKVNFTEQFFHREIVHGIVEFYLYPTVGTVLIHSVKPELTE